MCRPSPCVGVLVIAEFLSMISCLLCVSTSSTSGPTSISWAQQTATNTSKTLTWIKTCRETYNICLNLSYHWLVFGHVWHSTNLAFTDLQKSSSYSISRQELCNSRIPKIKTHICIFAKNWSKRLGIVHKPLRLSVVAVLCWMICFLEIYILILINNFRMY